MPRTSCRTRGWALLRLLADNTGLTGGLSRALASPRLLIHDRGRVTADLACAIADDSEVISDFQVLTDQKELFGLVASVPTTWRTLDEIGFLDYGDGREAGRRHRDRTAAPRAARHGSAPPLTSIYVKLRNAVACGCLWLMLNVQLVSCERKYSEVM